MPLLTFFAPPRLEHETAAIAQVHKNAQHINSMAELTAFLFLGGHQGYFKYTHNQQQMGKSTGFGWGE
jgi:hypothetical protein